MRTVIGVMGSGTPLSPSAEETAVTLGRLIAEEGWVLLNGGRDCGVMDASARGAKAAGGLVVGVLPGADLDGASSHLDIALPTGLGHGRNYVNAHACSAVIALPGGAGTLSEVCFALIAGKTVVTIGWDAGEALEEYRERGLLIAAAGPAEAVAFVREALARAGV